LPWAAAIAAFAVFPSYLPLGSQILATILFALSADLVLGYGAAADRGNYRSAARGGNRMT
jgi:branched-chain amino acid transport system permease protein